MTTRIADWVADRLEMLGLETVRHPCGAVEAILPGERDDDAVVFVSHFDTLGAQAKALKQNGRVELVPIGTWSSRFAEGARATLFTDTSAVRGTILPLKASGHVYNDEVDTQPTNWRNVELRIDAPSDCLVNLEALGIHVGDWVAIDPQPEFSDAGFLVSRHLDNKAGVAIMLETLKGLVAKGGSLPRTSRWLFTAAEEVGLGAAGLIHPSVRDLIAIDNGTVAPGQKSAETGVTIAMADQNGPFDHTLTHEILRICQAREINHQRDVFRYYHSDASSARRSGANVRTALVTFGVDASHGYERCHVDALHAVGTLLTNLVQP
jgi:peptidase M42 family hydrolase